MEMLKAAPFTCPLACAKPVMDRMGISDVSLGLRGVPRQLDVDELKIIQPAIGAEFLHQLFVAADVRHSAVFENYDPVGAANGRKSVSDDDHSASRHKILQRRLDQRFGFAVQRGSGFVEDEDR